MQKLALKATNKTAAAASSSSFPVAAVPVLTPLTHTRAVEQIRNRAVAFEEAGDFSKAYAIYQGALSLVGEDDEYILTRMKRLKDRMGKENGKSNQQEVILPPPSLMKKTTNVEEEEEFEPLDDDADSEPGTMEKKPKKRERKSGGGGGGSKKVKASLSEQLQVSGPMLDKLLQLCNTGTIADLLKLQGVGKKRAQTIIAHRKTAEFGSVDDLARCGFGKKTITNLLTSSFFE